MTVRTIPHVPAAPIVDPITQVERVGVIDVLRGFALFGILLVNMAAFKAPVFGGAGNAGLLDQAALWLIAFGFQTKFYVLFSFLFGYGLSVQMDRAAARGSPFCSPVPAPSAGAATARPRSRSCSITGDILVTYALLGVVVGAAAQKALEGLAAGRRISCGSHSLGARCVWVPYPSVT
jgi:uncharacterized protein